MDVMCEICGKRKATETHHILPQKDADERGYVGHVPIHSVGNLQRLCEKCHRKITTRGDG
jgi:5-methylcytosine-specific restriction endonuclease McrA